MEVLPLTVIGLLLLPLVPWVIRGLAHLDSAIARALLRPSRQDELEDGLRRALAGDFVTVELPTLEARLEGFADEFSAILSRQIDERISHAA